MDSQVHSRCAATPILSSLAHLRPQPLQLLNKEISDLHLITNGSQEQSYNQDEEVKLFGIV